MPIIWDPYLVTLSVSIAVFGSFTALAHAKRMRESTGQRAIIWMVIGGVTFGVAIWAMHFIGMLAFHLNTPVFYDLMLTWLSVLPALASGLLGFYLLRTPTISLSKVSSGAIVMGLGISAMHYTGMAALKMSPPIIYNPVIVVASIGIAILAAYGALLIVYAGEKYQLYPLMHHGIGSVVMGLAISGMHYTAMLGTNFPLGAICITGPSAVDPAHLVLLVSTGVFILLGGGILASLFDDRIAQQNAQALKQLQKLHSELEERARAMALATTQELSLRQEALCSISQGVLIADAMQRIGYINKAFSDITGYTETELIGKNCSLLQGPETNPETVDAIRSAIAARQPFHGEILNYRKDGSLFWNELSITPVFDNKGHLSQFVGVQRDITQRKLTSQLELVHNQVLGLMAESAPLLTVLEALVRGVESVHPRAICSIMLISEDGQHLMLRVAPSLPEEFSNMIHNMVIGPSSGFCGRVAFRKEQMIDSDISSGPSSEGCRDLALRSGLQARWGQPILSNTGQILGVFAMYYREKHSPDAMEFKTIKDAANIASIAIEHALTQQELGIAATAFEAHEGMIVTGSNKAILRVNNAFCQMYGYSKDEVLGCLPSLFKSGNHDDAFYKAMWAKIQHDNYWAGEIWDKRKNGEVFPVWLTISAITAEDGSINNYLGTFSDISDYKDTQRELQMHRNHLQELVDQKTAELRASEAVAKEVFMELSQQKYALDQHSIVAMTDVQGRITYVNDKFCSISGYSRKELIGQDHILLNSGHHPHGFFKEMYRRVARGNTWQAEICNRAKDGHLYWVDTSIIPFMGDDGKPQQYIAIRTDITDRKLIEQALLLAKTEAEQANRAKSNFLAAMSHEIRTPMNGVIGMVDVLHQSSLQGYQVDMVNTIRDSAFSLLGIIEDILDFSKIEAGKSEVEQEPIDIAGVIEKICIMQDRLAINKGVELTLFTDPAIPAIVLGDAQRLRQIVVNLTNNAIKFSSRKDHLGRVLVQALLMEHSEEQSVIEIRVTDNGIGMNQETLSRLFTPFTQADDSTTRRFGGTGLGLTIASSLVQLMGGEIKVQSVPDQGSTFTVSLPLGAVTSAELDQYQTTTQSEMKNELLVGLNCLVVGDKGGLADYLAAYLVAAGAAIEQAPTMSAVEQWINSQPSNPCVYVIDASTTPLAPKELHAIAGTQPEQDIRFVIIGRGNRRRPRYRDNVQIVEVDGNVLTRLTVIEAVALAAGRMQPEMISTSSGKDKPSFVAPLRVDALQQGRLILVAEDNATNQKVILQQLALLGFAADVANDGQEALELWRSGDYALLLTDLHMPEMDGLQLTSAIRTEENIQKSGTHRIVIIALTANALKGEAQRCIDAGMDDYLSKPAPLENLKVILKKWLPNADTVTQADKTASTSVVAPLTVRDDELVPVDVNVLKALVGDDPEIIADFLQDFHLSAIKIAAELTAACADGQAAQVSAAAHKLKSSARSVGALALGDLSGEIEQAGKADQVEVLATLLPRFEAEMAAVSKYLVALRNENG
jgi:PAS domain S-box-containing protein